MAKEFLKIMKIVSQNPAKEKINTFCYNTPNNL